MSYLEELEWQAACDKCPSLPDGEAYPSMDEVREAGKWKVSAGGGFVVKEAIGRRHDDKNALSYKLMVAGDDDNDYKSWAEIFMWIPLDNLDPDASTAEWYVRKTKADAGKAFKLAVDCGIVTADEVKGMEAAECHEMLVDKFAGLTGASMNTSLKWEAYKKKDTDEVKGPYFSAGVFRVTGKPEATPF